MPGRDADLRLDTLLDAFADEEIVLCRRRPLPEHSQRLMDTLGVRVVVSDGRVRTEKHGDGLWHVVPAGSDQTVCGRPREPQKRGRPGKPTCGFCLGGQR